MPRPMSIDDIIGIESIKLGFFKQAQKTILELQTSNMELEQKRQDVQAILNGIPDVMAVISLEYELLTVNNAFFETYGIADPHGMKCYDIFKDHGRPCSPCPLAMAKEGRCNVCRNLQILQLNGENRQIECTASLMRDAEGNPGKVLLLQRDVTLEKQYQAKYFQAERMATVGVLAEGVAHEINNPLTSISGFAEALTLRMDSLAQCLREKGECGDLLDIFSEYLEIILMECNRCSDIVRNLLTFGHKEIRSFTIVNLNDVVSNCLKLLQPRLAQLPHGTISQVLTSQEPCVLGHPGELMQVVLNLVLNALYAVKESGSITIYTSIIKDMVVLKVIDTGHGICKEHLDKLFEPFFTTKPAGQGIGVGLSTCYNIITKHGGSISVESEPMRGAAFEIIMPLFAE